MPSQAFQLYRQRYTLYSIYSSGGNNTTACNGHDQLQRDRQKVHIHTSEIVSTSVETHYSLTCTFPKLLSIRQDTTQETRFTSQSTDHQWVEGALTVPPSESQPGHPVAARLRSLPLTVVPLTERVRRYQGPLFAVYSLFPNGVGTERPSSLHLAVCACSHWSCSVRSVRKAFHPTRRMWPLVNISAPTTQCQWIKLGHMIGRDWASVECGRKLYIWLHYLFRKKESVLIRVSTLQEYATVMHINTMLQFHGIYDCIANLCYTLLQPEHCTSLWKSL